LPTHPGTVWRRDWHREDAADHDAVFKHVIVVIVVASLAERARGMRAFEDKQGHGLE
jgi:hypothetical protein